MLWRARIERLKIRSKTLASNASVPKVPIRLSFIIARRRSGVAPPIESTKIGETVFMKGAGDDDECKDRKNRGDLRRQSEFRHDEEDERGEAPDERPGKRQHFHRADISAPYGFDSKPSGGIGSRDKNAGTPRDRRQAQSGLRGR